MRYLLCLALLACNDSTPAPGSFDLAPDQSASVVACKPADVLTMNDKPCATEGESCLSGCATCGTGLFALNPHDCGCRKNAQNELRWLCEIGDCFSCGPGIFIDSQCKVQAPCTDGAIPRG